MAVLFILSSVIFGFLRVIFRNFAIGSPALSSEISVLSFAWAILLGSAALVKREKHISVDTFYNILPDIIRKSLNIVFHAVIAAIGFLFLYYGIRFIISQRYSTVTYFGHPRWWTYYTPVPICGLGILIFSIEKIINYIINFNKSE